jgi:hypothetical protein
VCKAPAMRNRKTGEYTRCRMHGGASTGPRTAEGLERCRQARWKDGHRSARAVAERKRLAAQNREAREELGRQSGVMQLEFDRNRVLLRLDVLGTKAESKGKFSAAIRCEELICQGSAARCSGL